MRSPVLILYRGLQLCRRSIIWCATHYHTTSQHQPCYRSVTVLKLIRIENSAYSLKTTPPPPPPLASQSSSQFELVRLYVELPNNREWPAPSSPQIRKEQLLTQNLFLIPPSASISSLSVPSLSPHRTCILYKVERHSIHSRANAHISSNARVWGRYIYHRTMKPSVFPPSLWGGQRLIHGSSPSVSWQLSE